MENIDIILPKEIANMQLPDPELRSYYADLEQRAFWIDGEVTCFLLELVKHIIRWNCEDASLPVTARKPIRLFFFSPGGSLDVNYSLIDAIKLSKTPVIGINIGQCASAAAYIYLSCHKRYMMPHAYFIFHQGSGTISGTFDQIVSQVEDYQDQVEELSDFMLEHTKYSEEEVSTKIVGEWYVRKEEAIEKGVAHEVISDLSVIS